MGLEIKNARNAILVGVLTTAAVVAFYFSMVFLSEEYSERDTYTLHAFFKDASGVRPSTRVTMAGIQIGHVKDVRLEDGKALVEFAVLEENVLFDNATISRRTASILGDSELNVTPGTSDRRQLEDGDEIKRVLEEGSIQDIQRNIDDISEDVKKVSGTAEQVFGSPESAEMLEEIVANLHAITESLNATLEANTELVNKTIENVEGISTDARPEIQEILENAAELTADIKAISEDIRVLVDEHEEDVGESVTDLKASIKTLGSAIEKLDSTMTNIEQASDDITEEKGVLGKLISDEELAHEVSSTVEGANDLVGSVARLQTHVSLRTEYNFFANALKTYVAIEIQPREDRYYIIEIVDDPMGLSTVEVVDITSTHPDDPHYWHETRETTVDRFKFSFMFARRISFLTLRFGVKESSGGIGVDFHFMKDALRIETDLYEFGRNVYPNLKVAAALRFLRKIYIVGGVDDILNDSRDYFIGAQLRFTDEDLKAVLFLAPTDALAQ